MAKHLDDPLIMSIFADPLIMSIFAEQTTEIINNYL